MRRDYIRAGLLAGTAVALALAACGAEGETPAAPTPSQAYFPVQRCVNLANALNAPVEGDWGYRIEDSHLDVIKAGGFDSVRVLIDWHSHADAEPPYRIDPAYFERIDHVASASLEAGLAVIIDMHDYNALYADPETHGPRATEIWRQIAEHYSDAPPELIFEPVNEPRDALSGIVWEALAGDLVRAIRKSNPTRTIILGGDNWSSLYGLTRLHLPDDPYLVATFHYYEPYEFTHQGADWFDDPPPAGRPWGTTGEQRAVEGHVAEGAAWGRDNATPVFLGEFGAFEAATASSRRDWTRTVREAAEAEGLPWCYFDFTTGFGVWDRETQDWIPEVAEPLGVGGGAGRANADGVPALRR